MSWLGAFVLTQVTEMPVHARVLVGSRAARADSAGTTTETMSLGMRLLAGFGASALTHPIVWFVLSPLMGPLGYWGYFAVAETFAVLAEAVYLKAFSWARATRPSEAIAWRRAFFGSLLANATSVACGMTTRALFEWP